MNFKKIISEIFQNVPPIPSWQWASENVDYSLAGNYDTPYRGMFDPDLMPFWKEPLESLQDKDVREVAVIKSARAGYSENLLLTDLRYTISRNPEPTMYISGTMEVAKGFHDRRVCRGMSLSRETSRAYKQAKTVNTEVQFPDMDYRSTWASSDTATKSDGWSRIHCDEVSLWPEFGVDMVRRRCAAYPFHHIAFGGSIDPTRKGNPEEDPILKLYKESDRRVWRMPDPAGGDFQWTFSGIKWPEECKTDDGWDMEAVSQSAWYETPNGTKITEEERMAYTRSGYWVATNPKGIRRGYKVVAPMVPFQDCSFGQLAKAFLSAKNRINLTGKRAEKVRNTIRTYMAEYWAEAHREEEMATSEDKLAHCQAPYKVGEIYVPGNWTSGVYATCDVQKYHIWWLCRTWAFNKETEKAYSALLACGNAPSFEDMDVTLGEFKPSLVGIDIGYALRQSEVADYCSGYADFNPKESRVLALRGNDKLKAALIQYQIRDAMEGRTGAGVMTPYLELTWAPDVFRTWLMESISSGEDWKLPESWEGSEREQSQYMRQITSTRKLDGEWVASHKDDHFFDCEAMQFVLARWDGII